MITKDDIAEVMGEITRMSENEQGHTAALGLIGVERETLDAVADTGINALAFADMMEGRETDGFELGRDLFAGGFLAGYFIAYKALSTLGPEEADAIATALSGVKDAG